MTLHCHYYMLYIVHRLKKQMRKKMIVDIIPTYYRLIFSNGYVQSPMWINQDYFKHGQDLSIEKYCKRQVVRLIGINISVVLVMSYWININVQCVNVYLLSLLKPVKSKKRPYT